MFANICTHINQSLVPLLTLAAFETIAVILKIVGISNICPIAFASEFLLSIKTLKMRLVHKTSNDSTNDSSNNDSILGKPTTTKRLVGNLKFGLKNFVVLGFVVATFLLPVFITFPYFQQTLLPPQSMETDILNLKTRAFVSRPNYVPPTRSTPSFEISVDGKIYYAGSMGDHASIAAIDTSKNQKSRLKIPEPPSGQNNNNLENSSPLNIVNLMDVYPSLSSQYVTKGCSTSTFSSELERLSKLTYKCGQLPETILLTCIGSQIKLIPRRSSIIDCTKDGYGSLWAITTPLKTFIRLDGSQTYLKEAISFETLKPQMETTELKYLTFSDTQIRQLQSYFFLKGHARVYVTRQLSDGVTLDQQSFVNANQLSGYLSNKLYGSSTKRLIISTYSPTSNDQAIILRSVILTGGFSTADSIKGIVNEYIYDISVTTGTRKLNKRSESISISISDGHGIEQIEGNENSIKPEINSMFVVGGIMIYYVVVISLACFLGRRTCVDFIYAYFTGGFGAFKDIQCVHFSPFWKLRKHKPCQYDEESKPTDELLNPKPEIKNIDTV